MGRRARCAGRADSGAGWPEGAPGGDSEQKFEGREVRVTSLSGEERLDKGERNRKIRRPQSSRISLFGKKAPVAGGREGDRELGGQGAGGRGKGGEPPSAEQRDRTPRPEFRVGPAAPHEPRIL